MGFLREGFLGEGLGGGKGEYRWGGGEAVR